MWAAAWLGIKITHSVRLVGTHFRRRPGLREAFLRAGYRMVRKGAGVKLSGGANQTLSPWLDTGVERGGG